MHILDFESSDAQHVIDLYSAVFSDSEGEVEGQSIGQLVYNLIHSTPSRDLKGFVSKEDGECVGCIFFSRFDVPSDVVVFMLSPVAISTQFQGQGLGQQLINFGLETLKSEGVNIVLTYGDPAFYSKVGFEQISEDKISAPFPLSQPIGWLAQSLDGQPIADMGGPTKCVESFNDPGYW